MTDLLQELHTVFEVERQEHLEQIRVILARIAAGRPAQGDLTEAMRRIHSLERAGGVIAVDLGEVGPVEGQGPGKARVPAQAAFRENREGGSANA